MFDTFQRSANSQTFAFGSTSVRLDLSFVFLGMEMYASSDSPGVAPAPPSRAAADNPDAARRNASWLRRVFVDGPVDGRSPSEAAAALSARSRFALSKYVDAVAVRASAAGDAPGASDSPGASDILSSASRLIQAVSDISTKQMARQSADLDSHMRRVPTQSSRMDIVAAYQAALTRAVVAADAREPLTPTLLCELHSMLRVVDCKGVLRTGGVRCGGRVFCDAREVPSRVDAYCADLAELIDSRADVFALAAGAFMGLVDDSELGANDATPPNP